MTKVSDCGGQSASSTSAETAGGRATGGEPVAWMWQHDETGRVGFVDSWQLENGWRELNPRLHVVGPLYRHPAAPLTDEQIEDVFFDMGQFAKVDLKAFARAVERAHGITGDAA